MTDHHNHPTGTLPITHHPRRRRRAAGRPLHRPTITSPPPHRPGDTHATARPRRPATPRRPRRTTQRGHDAHAGHGGHGDHVGQFRRLFWIMLVLAVPVVGFSPMFAMILGYTLPAAGWVGWVSPLLGTVMYVWGGRPFLTGAVERAPGADSPG